MTQKAFLPQIRIESLAKSLLESTTLHYYKALNLIIRLVQKDKEYPKKSTDECCLLESFSIN